MRILVISPLELPYTVGARYTGLERLAVGFATEWAKLGHAVSILAHKDTNVGHGVTLLPCEGYPDNDRTLHAEQRAFQRYQSEFYKYDVLWDISNLHLPARIMPQLKTCNVFHANPQYAFVSGYVKAPYNLVSWSRWGVREIARYYKNGQPTANGGQKSVYQETIMVDPEVYKPSGKPRTNRFLTLGRMSEEKGNLNVAILCKELGLPLDIAGGRGSEKVPGQELTQYEKDILKHCDGKNIVYHGEVSDEEKIELMQSCRALLYITDHVEITSHKIQEAMLCFPEETIVTLEDEPLDYRRREYTGQLVNIVTDKGIIRATPEHPFMTNDWWCHARHLTTKHQLVYNTGYDKTKSFYNGGIGDFGKLVSNDVLKESSNPDGKARWVCAILATQAGIEKVYWRPTDFENACFNATRTSLLSGYNRRRRNRYPKETQQQIQGGCTDIEYQSLATQLVAGQIYYTRMLASVLRRKKSVAMGNRGVFISALLSRVTSLPRYQAPPHGDTDTNVGNTYQAEQKGNSDREIQDTFDGIERLECIKEIYLSDVTNCPVYNFTTTSGTYLAGGFLVHNCGAPVIIPNHGGFPEIVTQGIDGFLCDTEQGFVNAIEKIDFLDPVTLRDMLARKYHPKTVAQGYVNLFERIIKGERW